MSTMRDVARLAGVSAKTVSRVMNNDRYVSDDVRARVLQAVEELQYVPNVMARSFRAGQDTAIGVAVPILNEFFGRVVESVERMARERGVAMYLTCLGDDPGAEQPLVESLLSRNVVGCWSPRSPTTSPISSPGGNGRRWCSSIGARAS